MQEEMNRGLGSLAASVPVEQMQPQSQVQSVPEGYEKTVAIPNSSLAMLNEKRVADNVVQERNTGITLGKIKDEAKAELVQEMMANEADKQQRMADREAAIGHGYKTGLYDASTLQQAAMSGAMQSQPDTSYAQNYSEPVAREQSGGLGRLYL